ncbi:hypothetical protein OG226_26140 [Streptomyces sp. NBC_01261]|uniref:hypothetical protein n=1 Tax=Streptomyces sp. NBC_01261 TaxID=2903802 RepID=UPI002E355FED|nr:hypothetical protein [Streptomyces sp. NBC_01261]
MHGPARRVEQAQRDRARALVPRDHRRVDPVAVEPQRDRTRPDGERLAGQARLGVAARLVDPGDRASGHRLDVLEERRQGQQSGDDHDHDEEPAQGALSRCSSGG